MIHDDDFQLRIYRKSELAMLYFPGSTKENDFDKPKDQRELAHFGLARNRTFKNALRNLGRWIARCEPLRKKLETGGYDKHRKSFLKQEVALIVHYLGEP